MPVFDGVDPRCKRILWTVIGLDGAVFPGEMVAGQLAGSRAFEAAALDVPADTATHGLSLAVIGASLRTAGLAEGAALSPMALVRVRLERPSDPDLGLPKAEVMGVVGVPALAVSTASGLPPRPYMDGDADARSVRLCPRNDTVGNPIAMVAAPAVWGAAPAVWGTATAWPDLIAAGVVARIFPTSSVRILRQVWATRRGDEEVRAVLRHRIRSAGSILPLAAEPEGP